MEKIRVILATIAGAISYFIGGIDSIIITLIIFISLDYVTGVLKAIMNKTLSSEIGFKGITKKCFIIMIVGMCAIIDRNILNTSILRDSVAVYYIANEMISMSENAAEMGLPIPEKLIDILSQLKKRGGKENNG